MENWDRERFGLALRTGRAAKLPRVSQGALATAAGTSQAQISRWEQAYADQHPPSFRQTYAISEALNLDWIEVLEMCGHLPSEIRVALKDRAKGVSRSSDGTIFVDLTEGAYTQARPLAYAAA